MLQKPTLCLEFFFFFFLIQFYVPFKIISAHMGWANQWVGEMGEPREKPPGTLASRTWLVSHVARPFPILWICGEAAKHVARVGLEPTQDTAVR